jgi:hypothetical protein
MGVQMKFIEFFCGMLRQRTGVPGEYVRVGCIALGGGKQGVCFLDPEDPSLLVLFPQDKEIRCPNGLLEIVRYVDGAIVEGKTPVSYFQIVPRLNFWGREVGWNMRWYDDAWNRILMPLPHLRPGQKLQLAH